MLTEEALIVLAALGALGLVVLGTLELLWPSRPKHPARGASTPAEPAPRRWRSSIPRHAASRREAYLKMPPASALAPAPAQPPFPRAAPAAPVVEVAVTPAVESSVEGPIAIVDRCFELYQQHRYADVVSIAAAALGNDAPPARRPAGAREAAALWSVLALAQQALGDHAGARAALEAATEASPEAERATYRRQLVTLALGVARDLIASSGAHVAPDSESRVGDLRDALAWLDRGRAAAPGDTDLRDLAVTAEARLWPAYEQVVMALVQRQEFPAARRLLREALAHPRVPAARAETFRELFSGTFSGEIGQLTAQAIRAMQEARETEALGSLERAERLLESVHDEALPPKRREEVDRRLWWGYNKLGLRRVEAGAFEEAIEPLLRALRLAGTAPDRQSETRAALVRAFEGWTETSALAIREVADAGDREAAIVRSDKLWTRLRTALEEGLSERELAGAFTRVRRLFEEIGREPA
ncbi:MAG: hypothetical protein DMD80_07340 [Candidatus Rokuibacteriota bacterium]|nr:MAG: hypothetical protein DMD80_07340 [Candidatus Rokubacteria bacterium]